MSSSRLRSPSVPYPNTAFRLISYVFLVIFMGNLGALVDLVRHPEIPYLDQEHLVTGGFTALIMILLLVVLETYLARRRQIDEALRDSEAKHRLLFESANDVIFIHDAKARMLAVNPLAVERLGYTHAELLSMTINQVDLLEEGQHTPERIARLIEHGHLTFETVHQRKDGSLIPTEVSTRRITWDGQPAMMSICRGITQRKQAERELQILSSRNQAILEAIPDIITEVDTSKVYTWANQAGIEFFGEDVIGTEASFFFEGEQDTYDTVQPLFDGAEDVFYVESWQRRRDGEKRLLAWWCRVLKDASGNVTGALSSARDITDLLRAEEDRLQMQRRVQQSQRLESLGVLAGGIAHDFNNILMSVLGNAELALTGLSPSAPARENLLEIMASSHRAADLCRQMLAYSGRGRFVTEAIDPMALVEDMLGLLKGTISKKALLNLNLGKNLPPMRGDASQISQVIMNLVLNASEAIGERSGVITVSTGATECSPEYLKETYGDENLAPGLYLTLEVSDTGAGMDKTTQGRIFEPFFTTKFTGRGLGLAAVLGIVRGHKGALRVYSEVGKGTTFKILFPVSEADAESLVRKNDATKNDWQGEGTVLLVDDEETIRTLGARMLASLGFTVLTAADGQEALAVYREHRGEIEVVVLDLTMPHMDGEEAFRELRLIDPEVRVVMSSGYTESDITARFAGKGLVGFVQKPYSLAKLAEQLQSALNE